MLKSWNELFHGELFIGRVFGREGVVRDLVSRVRLSHQRVDIGHLFHYVDQLGALRVVHRCVEVSMRLPRR